MVQTIALGTAVYTGLAPNACRRMNGWPDRFYQRGTPKFKKVCSGRLPVCSLHRTHSLLYMYLTAHCKLVTAN